MLIGVWAATLCLTVALSALLISPRFAAVDALLRVGLVVLMATPMMRVVLSITEAIRQKDWFWLWTTIAVMLILVGTMSYSLRTVSAARTRSSITNHVASRSP